MHIEWIHLSDFRNYSHLTYSPTPALNVMTGRNAQGKTNLIEAIGVLLVGRSVRAARPAEMARWDTGGATLTGELCRGETRRLLRRSVACRQDGAWVVAGEGCGWARAIPFGERDVDMVAGGPQARRSFLDGFAGKVYAAHLAGLARYRQVLARRNQLLQSGLQGAALEARLDPWDQQLAREGLGIVERRGRALAELGDEVVGLYPELAGGGTVRLEYRSALPAGITEDAFVAEMRRRRPEEVRRGQSLVGPHRDDVVMEQDGREVRTYGSRGQQRVLALALRLAEAGPVTRAVGSAPILLLDDALSELDREVQRNVLDHVEGLGQVFLTTADGDLPRRAAGWWAVRDGGVEGQPLEAVQGAA